MTAKSHIVVSAYVSRDGKPRVYVKDHPLPLLTDEPLGRGHGGEDRGQSRRAGAVMTYICNGFTPGCPDAPEGSVNGGHVPIEERHCWHESTRRRLEWQYGENRVDQADLAAWNRLGSGRRAAA